MIGLDSTPIRRFSESLFSAKWPRAMPSEMGSRDVDGDEEGEKPERVAEARRSLPVALTLQFWLSSVTARRGR